MRECGNKGRVAVIHQAPGKSSLTKGESLVTFPCTDGEVVQPRDAQLVSGRCGQWSGPRPKQMFNKRKEGRVCAAPVQANSQSPGEYCCRRWTAAHGLCRPGLPDPSVFTASGKVDQQDSLGLNLMLSGPSRVQAPAPGLGRQDLSRRP